MNKLLYFALVVFLSACDTSPKDENETEEMDTVRQEETAGAALTTENVQVEFSCNTVPGTNDIALAVLMQQYDKSIPVDTISNCQPIDISKYEIYETPAKINGLAEAGDYIYYSYVENNQLVIMRSPKGSDIMNYEVHMSVPIEPVVKEPTENQ